MSDNGLKHRFDALEAIKFDVLKVSFKLFHCDEKVIQTFLPSLSILKPLKAFL